MSRNWGTGKAAAAIVVLVASAAAIYGATRLTPDESQAFVAPFEPGQVIHNVVAYRTALLETGATEAKTEEYWTLVGNNNTVDKMRVLLRDSSGEVLQDGFVDSQTSRVGTYFTPGQPFGGLTLAQDQPRAPSVIAWNPETINGELLANGFVQKGEIAVAGRRATEYERVSPFEFNPADPGESIADYPYLNQFAGATEIIQRVFVSVNPKGLDLGEESFYRDSKGREYLAGERKVTLFEVVDLGDVPPGTFDWPHSP